MHDKCEYLFFSLEIFDLFCIAKMNTSADSHQLHSRSCLRLFSIRYDDILAVRHLRITRFYSLLLILTDIRTLVVLGVDKIAFDCVLNKLLT